MQDAWRVYLDMALGLAEVPKKKAQQVADELVARGGATAAQVQGLVTDALAAGIANRDALTKIVRFEVDRALGVVGLATADEVTELNARVRDLEKQLRQAQERVTAAESGAAAPDPNAQSSSRTGADDLPAPMPRPVTTPSAGPSNGPSTGEHPVAPKTGAKNAVAKKAVAKKDAVAKKAVAKKAQPADGPAQATTTAAVADAAASPDLPAPVTEPASTTPAPVKKVGAASSPVAAPAKKAPKKATAKKAPAGAGGPAGAALPVRRSTSTPAVVSPGQQAVARKADAKAGPAAGPGASGGTAAGVTPPLFTVVIPEATP